MRPSTRSTEARSPSVWSPARKRPRSAGPWAREYIIDRNAEGYQFWKDEHTQNPKEWQRLGKKIRELTGGGTSTSSTNTRP